MATSRLDRAGLGHLLVERKEDLQVARLRGGRHGCGREVKTSRRAYRC